MVTFAQAQERAERWVNGPGAGEPRREVRVREFDLGFVAWAEESGGGQAPGGKLVIARDSGDTTLWPALPVSEVIRRYEEVYGTAPAAVPAAVDAAKSADLNQTSFLLTPPQWLQEAADRTYGGGIPAQAAAGEAGPGGEGAQRPGADSAPAGQPASSDDAAPPAAQQPGAEPAPAGQPAPSGETPKPAAPPAAPPSAPSPGPGGTVWPSAGGGSPWDATDTSGSGSEDASVAPPATVFAPSLSEDDGEKPPAVSSEARTAVMPQGSALPKTAVHPSMQKEQQKDQGSQGGQDKAASPPSPPPAPPGPPRGDAAAIDFANAATEKAPGSSSSRPAVGGSVPPPPSPPSPPGARGPAKDAGYVPTRAVSAMDFSKPSPPGTPAPPSGTPAPPSGTPAPPSGPPAPPSATPAPPSGPPGPPGRPGPQGPADPHGVATMLAQPGGPSTPAPPGPAPGTPPPPPGPAPGTPPPPPGTPAPPGAPAGQAGPASGYGYPAPGQPTVGSGYMAVLRYRSHDGSEQQIIRRSAPGMPHPEWQILHELRSMNVPPQSVLELHTELQSCELPGGYCARMIRETWPQVRITHTAAYGQDLATRQAGVRHLIEHQDELKQFADGPPRSAPVRVPLPQKEPAPAIGLDVIGQELAQAFGPQGVFRYEPQAASRQGVPDIVVQTLTWSGLPLEISPFFWALAQPGRPVPTLAEVAAERGIQPAPDAGSYLVIGSDYGRQLCVQYGTAYIVAVPLEPGPGGQPVAPRFVNASLPQFVRSMALLGRMWRLRYGLSPEQAGRWTTDFQEELASLDPQAVADPESWWSVLLEQMWDGLL